MFSWFLNPWMLLGSIAVASPILIHLLNKRRFKVVQWAAMDFLFQADKKNRRRVQLESFILLALRCLAMFLIALMLARPFLPSAVTNVLQQSRKLERILLVDDSLSQQLPQGNSTAFEQVKGSAKDLLAIWATDNDTQDWLTVIRTSDPDNPVLANEPLTVATLPTINQAIDRLSCTDRSADYVQSLDSVARYISGQRDSVGRAVYVFSDIRRKDWNQNENTSTAPNKLLSSIGKSTEGCFLIDTGQAENANLSVVSVRPTEFPIAGKVIPFEVTVKNFGAQAVSGVRVVFQVNDSQPDYETMASLPPGKSQTIEFRYLFPPAENDPSDPELSRQSRFTNYKIRAAVDRQSLGDDTLKLDQLAADSEGLYAARVLDGIPVLFVDGAPSAVSERSETHYLRSLDVPGAGLKTTTVTPSELETISLSQYQVIFLCNVDEVSRDRIDSLKQWVVNGGGLVMMPGDRVRASTFNDAFFDNGKGLSPVRLETIQGDPTLSQWINFEVAPQIHPALQVVLNSEATSISKIDVFSWWQSTFDAAQLGKTISVPLRLTDSARSPGMVEKNMGRGRVVFFAFPADADWSMWPTGATFVPITLGLIDDFVGRSSDNSAIRFGDTIRYLVDISVYKNRVTLANPQGEKIEALAVPVNVSHEQPESSSTAAADGKGDLASSVLYQAEFPPIDGRGFYELSLQRNSGASENLLFAANVDVSEGDLRRVPADRLNGDFFSSAVSLVSPEQLSSQTVRGGSSEIWTIVLSVLFFGLLLEQFLGWFWGRKR